MNLNIPSSRKPDCREDLIRHQRSDGFTLIEILIATSILTLGLVGILALFPVAIKAGSSVVESSNAVVIAQSVVDAIRSGIRNSKGLSKKYQHPYFILRHDGVEDEVPSDSKLVNPKSDYYILLPRFKANRKFPGPSDAKRRADSLRRGKLFVYPESDTRASGGGNALLADDDGDDFQKKNAAGERQETYRVLKVYRLGKKLIPGGDPDVAVGFSEEFLGAKRVLRDMAIETLRQYSYAIKIRNSYYDADYSEDQSYMPANKLYHFTVMIFRGFPDRELRMDEMIDPVMQVYFEAAI